MKWGNVKSRKSHGILFSICYINFEGISEDPFLFQPSCDCECVFGILFSPDDADDIISGITFNITEQKIKEHVVLAIWQPPPSKRFGHKI